MSRRIFVYSCLFFGLLGFESVHAGCFERINRVKSADWQYEANGPVTRQFVQEFPIDWITYTHPVPNLARPGHNQAFIHQLMANIRVFGFDEHWAVPIILMPNGYYYCGGHHRTEAMRKLGETTIPVVIFIWTQLPYSARLYAYDQQPDIYGPWLHY